MMTAPPCDRSSIYTQGIDCSISFHMSFAGDNLCNQDQDTLRILDQSVRYHIPRDI